MKSSYPKPSVTVDITVFTIKDSRLKILLIKRNLAPFQNSWALPGGFVRMDESLENAAQRELEEETGVRDVYLEQLYTFGGPNRDPRGRVITVAYMALVNSDKLDLHPSTDASDAQWFDAYSLPELAFDHSSILHYALKRLRWKFEYTTVGFTMLSEKFTISQIQTLYEVVFNRKFDKRNFAKKIHSLNVLQDEGIVENTSYRPPHLYSLKKGIPDIIEII